MRDIGAEVRGRQAVVGDLVPCSPQFRKVRAEDTLHSGLSQVAQSAQSAFAKELEHSEQRQPADFNT